MSLERCVFLGQEVERSFRAELLVSEVGDVMAYGVSDAHEKTVVGGLCSEVFKLPGFEAGATADKHDGDVFESVAIAFSELVDPDDGGVIEHAAVSADFGGVAEFAREVSELLGEPNVDAAEFLLRAFVFIGLVAQ